MGRGAKRTNRKYSPASRFRHEETQQSRGLENAILTGEYDLTCTPVLQVLERDIFKSLGRQRGKIELQKASNHAGSSYAILLG